MASPLELRHLRTLRALREAGNLSRAAQLLNLTQSALSHQLKALEDHYGTALFERKSHPIRFGAAGQRLLLLADQLLPQIDAAEVDVRRLGTGAAGTLRVAVECHTCFDWLMPAMDAFRDRWPDVELDIVSGFHADPVHLLHQGRAEVAIVSEVDRDDTAIDFHALFEFEIVAVLPRGHAMLERPWLEAADFARQPLLTYPVPDDMLDLVRHVLQPAGVSPPRRTTELTISMLQLVASGRGWAALPLWAVKSHVDRHYVARQQIGPGGLIGRLHAATPGLLSTKPHVQDFVQLMRETSLINLSGIRLLPD